MPMRRSGEIFRHDTTRIDTVQYDRYFDPDKLVKLGEVREMTPEQTTLPEKSFDPDKLVKPTERNDETLSDVREIRARELSSTLDQRLEHLNNQPECWEGEIGNSRFIPKNEAVREALKEYGLSGIEFRNGVVDFSPVAYEEVKIDMTLNRQENFQSADRALAEKWNAEKCDGRSDWSARDVKQWRKEHGYTLHECSDQQTVQLVPTDIHSGVKHVGGVFECQLRERNANPGGNFDD